MSTLFRRINDLNSELVMSFHDFCSIKNMPSELEHLFYNFFEIYFKNNIQTDANNQLMDYLVKNMKYGDILLYYNIFLKNLKNTIEPVK